MNNDHTRPLYILLSNFCNQPIHTLKQQRVDIATPLDGTLINILSDEVTAPLAEETPLTHVTPPLVEHENAVWWQTIRIGETFAAEGNET